MHRRAQCPTFKQSWNFADALVFTTQVNGDKSFSATWQWGKNRGLVHSYPNAGLNNTVLPIQLSDVSNLNLALNWTMGPSTAPSAGNTTIASPIDTEGLRALDAKANVAVDMFLDADPQKAKSSVMATYEMMIWIGSVGGAQPFHSINISNPPTYNLNGIILLVFPSTPIKKKRPCPPCAQVLMESLCSSKLSLYRAQPIKANSLHLASLHQPHISPSHERFLPSPPLSLPEQHHSRHNIPWCLSNRHRNVPRARGSRIFDQRTRNEHRAWDIWWEF